MTNRASRFRLGREFVIGTDEITSLDRPMPTRYGVIGFDSMEKPHPWRNSGPQKEADAIRLKAWTRYPSLPREISK